MFKIILSIGLFGYLTFAQNREVIILSQAKSKKKAQLDLITVNKYIHFHSGYPKLVRSKSIAGLKASTWIWIGGFCKRDEAISFIQDKTTNATVSIALEEQKFFMENLKKIVRTARTQTVSAEETSCPIYNVEKDVRYLPTDTPNTAGLMWHKKPFSLPELSRYALDINRSIPSASSYLAAYGYKYLQNDENLLQIIYENKLKLQ